MEEMGPAVPTPATPGTSAAASETMVSTTPGAMVMPFTQKPWGVFFSFTAFLRSSGFR